MRLAIAELFRSGVLVKRGWPLDFILDLVRSWQIADQAAATASLEERVENLERQLLVMRELIFALLRDQRPDLAAQLETASQFTATVSRDEQDHGADLICQAADLESSGEWDKAIAIYQRVLQDPKQREHHVYARNGVNRIREKQTMQ